MRRASIASLKRAGLDQAYAMNEGSLDSQRRIDKTIRLRKNALSQKPKAIAKTTGRIRAVTSGSNELWTGRRAASRAGCGVDGMRVSNYAVGLREQHPAAKDAEDDDQDSFVLLTMPDFHTD